MQLVDEVKPLVREINVETLQQMRQSGQDFVLVDVREEHEWDEGYIPGAIHLGKGVIERDIEAKILDHAAELVLYCRGGYRSLLAGAAVQKMGYKKLASLKGGISAWIAAGLPVEQDEDDDF